MTTSSDIDGDKGLQTSSSRQCADPQAVQPRERPILFSGAMVRALLAGTKTQTRRAVKGQDSFTSCGNAQMGGPGGGRWWDFYTIGSPHLNRVRCPYGVPGDRLWVRESFTTRNDGGRAAPGLVPMFAADWHGFDKPDRDWDWSPSIHMPRWASRITLQITSVRVERLQDISEADAVAEGAEPCANGFWFDRSPTLAGSDARGAYYCLWEQINGPGSWDANPWVWVVEFAPTTSPPRDEPAERDSSRESKNLKDPQHG